MICTKKDSHGLTTRFDPLEWEALSGQDNASGRGLVFQNGVEIVHDAYCRLAKPGQHWLDVGCGTGRLTRLLVEKGCRVYGIDADETMLRFAGCMVSDDTPKPGSVAFVGASADRLPFGRETLDGVAAVSLMGCLARPQYFFAEIYRILRPGGYALLTFTNRRSVILRANNMLNRLTALHNGRKIRLEMYHLYRLQEALQLFVDTRLKVIEIISYNFFLVLSNRIIPRFLNVFNLKSSYARYVGSLLARNFFLIGRKP
jgi:ubiquinone/menaquinone biosynthesis C-methylase UbiE